MSGQPEVRFEDVSQKVHCPLCLVVAESSHLPFEPAQVRSEAMKVMKIIEEGFRTDGSVIGVASRMEM